MGLVRWFVCSMKRMLLKPFFVLFLIAIPFAMLGAKSLEQKDDGSIKVVLFASGAEKDGIFSKNEIPEGVRWNLEIIEKLVDESGTIEFVKADSEESLRKAVAAGQAECGYIFSEDLKKDLERQRAKRDIKTVVSEKTFMDGIINEKVFAAVFAGYAKDYLHEYEPETDALYEEYLKGENTFHFEYETVNGGVLPEKAAKAAVPVKGIGGLFIFVMSLAAAVLTATDIQAGVFKGVGRTAEMSRSFLTIAAMTAVAAVVVSVMVIAGGPQSVTAVFGIFLYGIATSVYAFAVVYLLKNPVRVASVIPVLAVASMLCCPVFVDIAAFVPAVKYVRILLPLWYFM